MPTTSLFNIPTAGTQGEGGAPRDGQQPPKPKEIGVVTSAQGTITFAVAPAAVTIVWKVLSNAFPVVASLTWFPVILSLIVGMAIYYLAPASGSSREKGIAFFFAFINSFAIAATTLGIDKATQPQATPKAGDTTSQKVPAAAVNPPPPALASSK